MGSLTQTHSFTTNKSKLHCFTLVLNFYPCIEQPIFFTPLPGCSLQVPLFMALSITLGCKAFAETIDETLHKAFITCEKKSIKTKTFWHGQAIVCYLFWRKINMLFVQSTKKADFFVCLKFDMPWNGVIMWGKLWCETVAESICKR